MRDLAGIFLSTFVAEDLTAIGAGLLVREGRVALLAATAACGAGIWVGDLGLWLLGRIFGRRAMRWAERRRAETGVAKALVRASPCRLPVTILASRLLPGTRLPLYVAAGSVGVPFVPFAMWTLLAVAAWTPLVIVMTVWLGPWIAGPLSRYFSSSWAIFPLTALALLAVFQGLPGLARSSIGKYRNVLPRLAERVRRWEFWPMWIFYAPVAAWTAILALKHGGFSTITAANPGIPDGGVVGESKCEIMRRLPHAWALPSAAIEPGAVAQRVRQLFHEMRRHHLSWPVILKPDVGQRGAGVRLIRSAVEARDYLATFKAAVLLQRYHSGPFEAGVFYYRRPGEPRGRILSITDKHFPAVTGDGTSTLEALVCAHPRYRMQARTFLSRLGARRQHVPAAGERVPLGIAGNHAQGALFKDGRHLITPALEDRIERIAQRYRGFYIGRFDVRYASVQGFMAGRDLAIVELNGATAESTDIYDPGTSVIAAYRTLFRQWTLVFEIGAANRARGAAVTPPARLFALIRSHLFTPAPDVAP